MQAPVVLVHSGPLQPLWQQLGLTQVGPAIQANLQHGELSVGRILGAVGGIDPGRPGVLLHYSDPFVLRARPLRGLRQWQGPRLLVCGDLHHGSSPIETLAAYLEAEPHDAVLLTFNPALVPQVRQRLRVPVKHGTTNSPEEAAALYAQHALVLNVPLSHGQGRRFFEVMAAGVPQVVFAQLAEPKRLRAILVATPPYWELKNPLKAQSAGGPRRRWRRSGAWPVLLWTALQKRPEIRLSRHQMWRGAADANRCTMSG